MPIDSHSYLVKQGWGGKGTALRQGAIARPIAIPQKRTLAGVGKDRDEAFPFWDHLFTIAAKTIQVKVYNDSDDESNDTAETPQAITPTLSRTQTGILSNKRPICGTPVSLSGTSTPSSGTSTALVPTLQGSHPNLLSLAKREAAKRGLYMRFYRGPVLAPDIPIPPVSWSESTCDTPGRPSTSKPLSSEGGEKEKRRKEKKASSKELPRSETDQEGADTRVKSEKRSKSKDKKDKTKSKKRKRDGDKDEIKLTPDDPSNSRKELKTRRNENDAALTCTNPNEPLKSSKKRKSKHSDSDIGVDATASAYNDYGTTLDKATRNAEKRQRKEEKAARRAEREQQKRHKQECEVLEGGS